MINPNSYYTVQGWMLSELGLKGNALAVYAIIYGFSQDGASAYSGSASYLADWLNCSKRTVLATLANLTEQGYLKKKTVNKNGVVFNDYVAVRKLVNAQPQTGEEISPPVKNFHGGGEKNDTEVVKNFHGGGEETSPHIDNHNDIHISNNINKGDDDAPPPPPPPPEKGKGKRKKEDTGEKPEKKPYGEYKHVKLTEDELAKLIKKHGEEKTAALIKYLDEYIEEKPSYKSQSHYLAIGRWVVDAVNEKARRGGQPSQPRGGRPVTVSPNGRPIDPSKNDLDAYF